jgi:tetratricopeptide (TPR) repeat protein
VIAPVLLGLALLGAQAATKPAAAKPSATKPPAAKPATAKPSGGTTSAAFEAVAAAAAKARDAGDLDQAIDLYRRGVALRPTWDEGRWYLASTLYEGERYAEARDAFAALIARQPTHAGAVGLKGLCEFGLGEHETALRTLLRARALGVQRNPEIAHAVAYDAGILLTRFGEFEIGYSVLTELSADRPESPQVIEALGLNVLRIPILPAAIPEAKRPMLQLAGRAAVAMSARRLADAAQLLDELVETYPREPNVHYARGVLRTTEAPDDAIKDFDAELALSPDHIPARLQIVFELVKRGEAARARPYAEDAVRIDPQDFAAHLAMGQVWFETGETAKAVMAFEQGVKLAPGSPQAHFLLARGYAKAGRAVDAERERAEFRKLEQLKSGQPIERTEGPRGVKSKR